MILLAVVASEDIDLTEWTRGDETQSCPFFNRRCLTTHGCGRVVPHIGCPLPSVPNYLHSQQWCI